MVRRYNYHEDNDTDLSLSETRKDSSISCSLSVSPPLYHFHGNSGLTHRFGSPVCRLLFYFFWLNDLKIVGELIDGMSI